MRHVQSISPAGRVDAMLSGDRQSCSVRLICSPAAQGAELPCLQVKTATSCLTFSTVDKLIHRSMSCTAEPSPGLAPIYSLFWIHSSKSQCSNANRVFPSFFLHFSLWNVDILLRRGVSDSSVHFHVLFDPLICCARWWALSFPLVTKSFLHNRFLRGTQGPVTCPSDKSAHPVEPEFFDKIALDQDQGPVHETCWSHEADWERPLIYMIWLS